MHRIFKYDQSWSIALYMLVILFGIAAILNMAHLHVLFLTTHAADLSGPAMLYIQFRKSWQQGNRKILTTLFGCSPEITASVFFFGSTATEIIQKYYPHGIFPGRFDPWDIVSYAVGVGICYGLEKAKIGMVESETVSYG
ncbi:MAG: hypothetical protein V1720_21775 [bacterium]